MQTADFSLGPLAPPLTEQSAELQSEIVMQPQITTARIVETVADDCSIDKLHLMFYGALVLFSKNALVKAESSFLLIFVKRTCIVVCLSASWKD